MTLRAMLMMVAVSSAAGGCGGDDEAAAPPPKTVVAEGGAAPKPNAPAAGTAGVLTVYPKVEERVPADEAKTIRYLFQDRDFAPDPTGNDNRDPFRSFVVAQEGLANPLAAANAVIEPTDTCTPRQQKASNYGLRDLKLVGIAARGLQRWALFQDSADVGHIVNRGDCLGKEKARVESIDNDLVTIKLIPEPIPGQPPRTAEQRSIPLHPDLVNLRDTDDGDATIAPAGVTVTTPGTAPGPTPGTTPALPPTPIP